MVFGIVFANRLGTDITLAPSPLIGQPAPGFGIQNLEDEGSFQLTDFEGRILVVNFWASWCLSCRAEHSALNAAASQYADTGVSFIGIAYQDERPASMEFLDELGWGHPYVYGFDGDSQIAIEFGVLGIPETFFVDRDGVVVGKVSGPLNASFLNRTLESLLLGQAIDRQATTRSVENR